MKYTSRIQFISEKTLFMVDFIYNPVHKSRLE